MKNKREKKRQDKQLQQYIKTNYDISKMVKVDDPEMWCPAYPNSEVMVHIGLFYSKSFSNTFLVISGMDDTVLELRFRSDDLEALKNVWNDYKNIYDAIPEITNFKWYTDRGFVFG